MNPDPVATNITEKCGVLGISETFYRLADVHNCDFLKARDIIIIVLWVVLFAVCVVKIITVKDNNNSGERGLWILRFVLGIICAIFWEYVMGLAIIVVIMVKLHLCGGN